MKGFSVIDIYKKFTDKLDRADWIIPTLARFIFAATLLVYYWVSALTKLGDGPAGLVQPSVGAYAQIFPRVFEQAGFDTQALGLFHWAVVTGGMWAEFILPALVVLGILTRLAALGMIGFVVLQSLTDVVGHGAGAETLGAWFDRFSGSLILDQRLFWVFILIVLVLKGAGPLSFDRALRQRALDT